MALHPSTPALNPSRQLHPHLPCTLAQLSSLCPLLPCTVLWVICLLWVYLFFSLGELYDFMESHILLQLGAFCVPRASHHTCLLPPAPLLNLSCPCSFPPIPHSHHMLESLGAILWNRGLGYCGVNSIGG